MKKFFLSVVCLFFLSAAAEAGCSSEASCENYQGTAVYAAAKGETSRPNENEDRNNWVEAPAIGVDCTDVTDSTAAIQTWVNTNLSGHLNFPLGCKFHTSSTIIVSSGTGITFSSSTFVGDGAGSPAKWTWKGANGGSSCAISFSSCIYVLDFEHSDHPVVQNLSFVSPGGHNCPDGFLKFDGNPGGGQIGTNGRIVGNSFSNGQCNNPNFVAVNISQTATNNHENYIVADNYVSCSRDMASIYAHDGVTNGTTILTSRRAPFSPRDVGKRIRISYAGGMLDTTIVSFTDPSTVVLAVAPKWTQSNVTIVVGTSNGIGYRNGASQNAIQQQFIHLQYSRCATGILIRGGNAQILQPSGGQSDIGVDIGGFVAQNVSIDFYASESDFQAVVLESGDVAPITISNSRFSNGNQMANGHVLLGNNVTFVNNLFDFNPPNNGVLIGVSPGNNPTVTSINNALKGFSWTSIGYSAFASPPVTSINDEVDQTSNPGQNLFGCWNKSPPCLRVANKVGHAGGLGLQVFSGNEYSDATTVITGFQSAGNADYIYSYTALQGVGVPGKFAGTQTAVEAAWDAGGINASGAGSGPIAAYGFRARSPASVLGTLPVLYGLYIDKQKIRNVTTGWGIYQADSADQNYFGGPLLMQKNTATSSAPGAGAIKMEVVCGTESGTAKLQAYAGTSSTPTTILDNIGSGVSGC